MAVEPGVEGTLEYTSLGAVIGICNNLLAAGVQIGGAGANASA